MNLGKNSEKTFDSSGLGKNSRTNEPGMVGPSPFMGSRTLSLSVQLA
jgi:hypothetical protein